MNREDIIRMAREAGGGRVLDAMVFDRDEYLERFFHMAQAVERETIERLKHAMREAMHLLDQPEPRPHAAFAELHLALNPEFDHRARGEK